MHPCEGPAKRRAFSSRDDDRLCPATASAARRDGAVPLVHLRAVETELNVVFKAVPTDVTAARITIERLPAIIAYSMAVAPPSSFRNRAPSPMRSFTDRLPDV